MHIQQIYTGCLSEAAYFIVSNGEAAVIDPMRDTDAFLKLAEAHHARITYIFETHFHADFVSGHLDLQKKTGAPIVYGPHTETKFPFHLSTDGEKFSIGNISIEVIHTPGHTLESSCYLLRDENGKPYCLFSGDTLFVGDVGRPDLSSGNLTSEELASIMYDSIQKKIVPLSDDIIVYPAHGPGSSCGKNLGPETQSTIGIQRQTNYAMKPQTREEFINSVTDNLKEAPVYFSINAKINKEGYDQLDEIKLKGLTPLSVKKFREKMDAGCLILDTREATQFTGGFIPGSISIGLEGRFAEWAGSLLPFQEPVILVTPVGKEEETLIRLARVGFNKVEGYLKGGYEAWREEGEASDLIIDIEADEMGMDLPFDNKITVLDVRRREEFEMGHVKKAVNMPLSDLTDVALIAQLEEDQHLYVHCAGGYRSVIAASLLKRQGYHNIRNVLGGWGKINQQKNIPVEIETKVLN